LIALRTQYSVYSVHRLQHIIQPKSFYYCGGRTYVWRKRHRAVVAERRCIRNVVFYEWRQTTTPTAADHAHFSAAHVDDAEAHQCWYRAAVWRHWWRHSHL